MAHSLSAKKRIRQNVKRRGLNRWRKAQVKDAVREFDEALKEGDKSTATEKLRVAVKQLDKTAAKGTIHKNTANRRKSRMARALNKLP